MNAESNSHSAGRGDDVLLHHCATLSRVEDARPTARERLDAALGVELARMLVGALAGHYGRPARSYR